VFLSQWCIEILESALRADFSFVAQGETYKLKIII
jgi:hypothetical protein